MHLSPDLEADEASAVALIEGMSVREDFLSEDEERSVLDEVEPYMNRLHYEFDHWDDVSGFLLFWW